MTLASDQHTITAEYEKHIDLFDLEHAVIISCKVIQRYKQMRALDAKAHPSITPPNHPSLTLTSEKKNPFHPSLACAHEGFH